MQVAVAERALRAMVLANNASIHRTSIGQPNPWPLDGITWHSGLARRVQVMRKEWEAFASNGGRLPQIEEILGEHQGNDGPWRAGLIVADNRATNLGASHFPRTLLQLRSVPGLKAALWSVMTAGTELPPHQGPNAGVLRYHLGIVCPEGAALLVDGTEVAYIHGEGVLFDDTTTHSAWNRSDADRVTLFCEVERPLDGLARLQNRLTQRVIGLDHRRRNARSLADRLDIELNSALDKR